MLDAPARRAGMDGFLTAVVAGPAPARVRALAHRAPLQAQRLLHLEPGVAHLCVLSPSGGVLAGDRLAVDVAAVDGARVHLTTQSATRVYKMAGGSAVQSVLLRAGPGSYLEYVPHPLILFAGADLTSELWIRAEGDGVVLASELLVPGRLARGERWAFDRFSFRSEATVDGALVLAEAGEIAPTDAVPGVAALGPGTVAGALYVVGRGTGALAGELAAPASRVPGAMSGASCLTGGMGAAVKVVATDRAACQAALRAAWDVGRRALIGAPATAVWD